MLIQIMENNEDILQALHEFENMSNAEKFLTQDLEDMLSYIAKTGRVLFPWNSLKPVFLFKLDKVMREFFENSPSRNATSSEPTVTADFEVMRQRLLDCLDSFTSAPFTIQRLCELMVEPRKNYSNSEKFMRGVEKNVLVVSTVDINRDDLAEMTLTNNVDGQHMLSNLPNGPVTNGIMTYAIPSEGNSVTDHGYNERVSHVTPDSVISQVTPDTSGSTPLNAHENGHDQPEHYNESSSSATESSPVEESNLPERQLSEEKCERDMNKVEGNVPQEEKTPEIENKDPGLCLDAQAEQEKKNSEEEKPELASEQKTEVVSEQTAEQTEIKETSPSPASEEEEPMDEN